MSTQSILFYGVFVKTAYLCFASDAFKKVKGSLLGIDLICARRRQGNLSTTEGHEGVKRVPEEVWKMIKAEVGGIAVFEAERKFVGGYAGYDMWDSEEEYDAACKWNGDMMNEWALQAFFTKGGMGEMLRSRSEVTSVSLASRENAVLTSMNMAITGRQSAPSAVWTRASLQSASWPRRVFRLRPQLSFGHQSSSPLNRFSLCYPASPFCLSRTKCKLRIRTSSRQILETNFRNFSQRRLSNQILPLPLPASGCQR